MTKLEDNTQVIVDKLKAAGLAGRIKIIASGKMVTPSAAAWAFCAGADFVASARGFMFALGCIQAMQCNKNTCPSGVATHNKRLQRGFLPNLVYQTTGYVRRCVETSASHAESPVRI